MPLPSGTEVLVAASIGGGGVVVSWFANQVVKIGQDMRQIKQAFYGDPDMKVPDGLVATVTATTGVVDALAGEMSAVKARVSAIENVCVIQHGDVIVRGQQP